MKRIVLALIALVMVLAFCAVAEGDTMYVANCGSLSVLEAPDYASAKLTSVMSNMPVTVTGDPVDSKDGKYTFVPVTVTQNEKDYVGYVNVEFLADEISKAGLTIIIKAPETPRVKAGLYAHSEPNTAASTRVELLPDGAVLELEYFVGGNWAFVSAKRNGKKEDIGYICWREFTNDKIKVGTETKVDPWTGVEYEEDVYTYVESDRWHIAMQLKKTYIVPVYVYEYTDEVTGEVKRSETIDVELALKDASGNPVYATKKNGATKTQTITDFEVAENSIELEVLELLGYQYDTITKKAIYIKDYQWANAYDIEGDAWESDR